MVSKLTIWDNSPQPTTDVDVETTLRARYSAMEVTGHPENTPLPVVYNTVSKEGAAEVQIILDQDSTLPLDFLEDLHRSATSNPSCNLFLPIVRSHGKIVSPGTYRLVKGKHWAEEKRGLISSKSAMAITSGIAIRRSYLAAQAIPFDERLNLYGVDTAFMLEYRRNKAEIFVTNSTIMHDSALWGEIDVNSRIKRFKNWRQATLIIHKNKYTYYLAFTYFLYLGIKYSLKYKRSDFLFV